MIHINPADLIGKGLHRKCYRHPENKDWCIKIAFNENIKETRREKKYYELLIKKNVSWAMLPRYHGVVETNLGPGAVFDAIKDKNGAISETLDHYLGSNQLTELYCQALTDSLVLFKDYLLEQQIITMNIKAKNILFSDLGNNSGRLVLVDNIGNSDYFPISSHIKFLANRKTLRKWQRFEASLLAAYPENTLLPQMLQSGD
jgi:hypothetical protein